MCDSYLAETNFQEDVCTIVPGNLFLPGVNTHYSVPCILAFLQSGLDQNLALKRY